jgi:hypothetical protein
VSALAGLDLAAGVPLGVDPVAPRLPPFSPPYLLALERAIVRALERPPCLVSFSGGRDSSVVLALAAHAARRYALPAPVPVTHRFPGVGATDESAWQELVVGHLRLADWVRLEWGDELDVTGPYAARVLERHGPVFPFNAHFQLPVLDRATGGALLTGIGGDEILAPHDRRAGAYALLAHRRPRGARLRRVAFDLAPRPVRRQVAGRRSPIHRWAWLKPEMRRRLTALGARSAAGVPLAWDSAVRRVVWPARPLQAGLATLRLLGEDANVRIVNPFVDPPVVAALARAGGPWGFRSRGVALEAIAGHLLPRALLRRPTKAAFDGAFYTERSRAFATGWDGDGVDDHFVDLEALATVWRSEQPDPHTYSLLQAAWLNAARATPPPARARPATAAG